MKIVTTHAGHGAGRIGEVHEFDINPICPDYGIVAGYDEAVSIVEYGGEYSGRLLLIYNAEAIVWDPDGGIVDRETGKKTGDFGREPVKIMTCHAYGDALIHEVFEMPEDGIGIDEVDDCLSIEINGKRRYAGNGSGSPEIIIEEDDDIDPLQLEKEYSSISTTSYVGQEPIIDGELPEVYNEMYRREAATKILDFTDDLEHSNNVDDEYGGFDLS